MQEIAMNILDIAYNSIKAQANLIKIIIHDSSKLNIINIQIIDNGIGMDKTTVKNVIDPFYTTRTTRKVGLGVPMFKENIEATGGTFKIESEVGKGTHVTGEFIKNHLDRSDVFKKPSEKILEQLSEWGVEVEEGENLRKERKQKGKQKVYDEIVRIRKEHKKNN